ncbi:MAG: aspartyl protease [Microcystis panniformis Mp_MB_F_20051200_S9]|uniref:Aspartyl protease n=1 Tax=Microcystis panniformis Mp_MB_F_20051200_S9 TaxID=2486223 RepID=A0A552Q8T2_9CHRO|nr:MAG: aspartyl protease [Microcystis panniformis Mp_MB_F_20080800_S26D]TRV53908.1 MAG: aspartyl protease [Microcystis panniformis Mp_GB_SS_20050300_S99D]TRV54290.1 MAG: aspartyl protease [Microcystis panniformis Mp_GB_SS_20050300_S99]TRV56260.1 MAG: aspartyl protease [Microcystis panniformis Mp_MB_F_20080800_S26]TRV65626.1 MAG: aspartyl protease [Microcystis panniformis Mp_MB_F_20051200_S9]TRV67360.1 MAG: aspartyl protease [Microcystis panniformis Mp_MB_F_20051200_S6]TRV69659.1 MAG: asparty
MVNPAIIAEDMGKIYTSITVINRADQILAAAAVISPDQIRSLTLENVLVDTGTTTLCLMPEVISRLGLQLLKEVDVATAKGIGKARIFRDATLIIAGREGTFECLELPGGQNNLLGVIPLEALGLEPDLRSQKLRVLPTESNETYLTILSNKIAL